MPEDVEQSVTERNHGHRLVTGACDRDEVGTRPLWLIPPVLIGLVSVYIIITIIGRRFLTNHFILVDDVD